MFQDEFQLMHLWIQYLPLQAELPAPLLDVTDQLICEVEVKNANALK